MTIWSGLSYQEKTTGHSCQPSDFGMTIRLLSLTNVYIFHSLYDYIKAIEMQVMSLKPFNFNLTISHGYCKESGMSDFDVLSWL